MRLQPFWPTTSKAAIAGLSVLLAIGLLSDLYGWPARRDRPSRASECQKIVSQEVQLTKEQLLKLLVIAEGNKRDRIRQILPTPYCTLPTLQIRAGAQSQREAYPLAFDPTTWLIILYEGDQYTGYRFALRSP